MQIKIRNLNIGEKLFVYLDALVKNRTRVSTYVKLESSGNTIRSRDDQVLLRRTALGWEIEMRSEQFPNLETTTRKLRSSDYARIQVVRFVS